MIRGPIDYVVIGFDSSEFDGSVIKTLEDAVNKGIIAVIDLAVIAKDKEGVITQAEVANLGNEEMSVYLQKYKSAEEMLNDDDVKEIADLMDNNTMAAVLIIEHLWAKPLKQALIDKKGYLVAEGRIHPDAAAELEEGGK